MRGRPPKPTAVKRLEGNPGKRKLPQGEPQPDRVKPRKPRSVTRRRAASRFWNDHADPLVDLGILTGVDGAAFRLMAEHYATAVEALADMQRDGDNGALQLTRMDENGVERKHPLLQIFRDNSSAFLKYADRFGLNPSARARLKTEAPAEQLSLVEQLFQAIDASGE